MRNRTKHNAGEKYFYKSKQKYKRGNFIEQYALLQLVPNLFYQVSLLKSVQKTIDSITIVCGQDLNMLCDAQYKHV